LTLRNFFGRDAHILGLDMKNVNTNCIEFSFDGVVIHIILLMWNAVTFVNG